MQIYFEQITKYLFTQSWQIAILVAVIAAISFVLKNKSAHVRYLLWLIVLAKCIVPPLFAVPLAILPPERPGLLTLPMPSQAEMTTSIPEIPQREPPITVKPIVTSQRTVRPTPAQTVALLWLTGAAVFLLVAIGKAIRTNRWLKRRRRNIPANVKNAIERAFTEFGLKKYPRVWLIEGIGQPFVWGLFRGSIYLPAKFASNGSGSFRRDLLGHELCHILRFDAAANLLQVISQAIFWFHPFVWWANKRIRAEREKCCDEMAIARIGVTPKDYSTAIVNILVSEYESTRPVPSLAIAGPVKNIEERIKTMLRPGKKFYKRPSLIAATVVLLLALLIVPTALVLTARAETKPTSEQKLEPPKSLHQAAADGDIEKVKLLISKGTDVNEKDNNGSTPLHEAAANGCRDVVQLLLAKGANVAATDASGQTPLHRASSFGVKYVPELLLAEGANVNARDNHGNTPLHTALLGGVGVDKDFLEYLVAKGGNVKARNEQGETPLHLAPKTRRPARNTQQREEAANVLLAHGAEVNATDNSGRMPLHVAVENNQAKVVALLLAKGAAVDKKTKDGLLALDIAVMAGYKEIVAMLLAKGANINTVQPNGQTPLHVAAQAGHNEIAELLIAKGADVNTKNARGETPAQVALAQDPPGMVRLLLATGGEVSTVQLAAYAGDLAKVKGYIEKGISVNTQDGFGLTPLHAAAAARRKEVAEYLISAGASVNAASAADGLGTPLHYAAHSSSTYVADLLIFKGARVDAENSKGETPLHLAAKMGHTEMCRRLISSKANVNPRAQDGSTPLHYATASGQKDAATLLLKKGADIDASASGRTPLNLAARERHKEVVKLLVDKGADVSASSTDLLYYAAWCGYKELAEACIKKGADVNSKAWRYPVALFVFYDYGPDSWGDVLELLLAHGADPDAKENSDWSLLHYAVYEDINLVRMLLDRGANPNVIDAGGKSPLHWAAREGRLPQVELLIAQGADPHVKDYEGRTPLSLAKEKGHNEIVELLREHGVKK
jgi:ankyrin repeat protein/beta-lactamase regulating signal transducer with metallopeptidase domain